jgi:hypothetical protein
LLCYVNFPVEHVIYYYYYYYYYYYLFNCKWGFHPVAEVQQ